MMNCNKEFALKTAIELAKQNIESSSGWISPDHVTRFIEEVYTFLTGENTEE